MDTRIAVKEGNLLEEAVEAILVGLPEEGLSTPVSREINERLQGLIDDLYARKAFTGKKEQVEAVYTAMKYPFPYIILCGLGKGERIGHEEIRCAAAKGILKARDLGLKKVASSSGAFNTRNLSIEEVGRDITEGALLALYRFSRYKVKEQNNTRHIEDIIFVEAKGYTGSVERGARLGKTIAESVYLVRDLVNHPANDLTPSILADKAREITRSGKKMYCKVLAKKDMEKLGMGAFLGVAKGSHEPPRFIIVEYRGARKGDKPVVIVGKSITFDSGGISLKPSEGMGKMKYDMSGGAITLGILKAVSSLNLPLNVIGILPATENMPGGGATRPGDILRSMSGRTIEIISTDAEGRLTLADGLFYATTYKPKYIVDIATLTGACVVALGSHAIGMLGNNEPLKEKIKDAGNRVWERVWEMPLWDEYYDQIKSSVADIKNSGGREGGVMTGAIFLSKFVEDYPWVHLDIAGVAWVDKDRPYIPAGASGIGTRLLIQFLLDTASKNN